jgi:hypothetical protein
MPASLNLTDPATFRDHVARPERLAAELSAAGNKVRTILLDEFQRVPALLALPALYLGRRFRHAPSAWQECRRHLGRLQRRLQRGDPVHQRLLASLQALARHARLLENQHRRGLAEGWPGETARAGQGSATILFRLRTIERTLDQAARAGRGEFDTRLVERLGQDMEAALAARREAEQIA